MGALTCGLASTGVAKAYHNLKDEYGTVINVVDAGGDPNGEKSVSDVVQQHIGDDTFLKFPPGTYYMDEQVRFTDFDHVCIQGDDATIVPADYHDFDGPQYRLFRLGTSYAPGRDLKVRNLRIDQTADDTGIRAVEAVVSDGLEVSDITVAGRHDSGTWGPGLFAVTDGGGEGVVRNFRAPDGGAWVENTPNDANLWRGPTGIISNSDHRGTLRYRNCVLGGFPDNGLYASGGPGIVSVEGGTFSNSGTANVRLGGRRGTIEGARIVVDHDHDEYDSHAIRLDFGNWLEVRNVDIELPYAVGNAVKIRNGVDGVGIRNVDLSMGDDPATGIRVQDGAGPVYIEDSEIDIDGSGNAIAIHGDGGEVGVQNVTITGDAGGAVMRHAVRCERDNCAFRELDIHQSGGHERRGLALVGGDFYVDDCEVATTHRAVTVKGDSGWIEDSRFESFDGAHSIEITDEVDEIRLKNNDLPDGIDDDR